MFPFLLRDCTVYEMGPFSWIGVLVPRSAAHASSCVGRLSHRVGDRERAGHFIRPGDNVRNHGYTLLD